MSSILSAGPNLIVHATKQLSVAMTELSDRYLTFLKKYAIIYIKKEKMELKCFWFSYIMYLCALGINFFYFCTSKEDFQDRLPPFMIILCVMNILFNTLWWIFK